MYEFFELQNAVRRIINVKIKEYAVKYNERPHYVKLPVNTYRSLRISSFIYTNPLDVPTVEMIMGLIVCPTQSIKKIEEIEVF